VIELAGMQMALWNFISSIRLANGRSNPDPNIQVFDCINTTRRNVKASINLAAADSILAAKQTCFKGSANSIEIYYSSVAFYLNTFTGSQFTALILRQN
jgi:hypothetical protein